MIITKNVFLFFFCSIWIINSIQAACHLQLHEKILSMGELTTADHIIKNSSCNDQKNQKIVNFISQSHGTISATVLIQELFDDPNITLAPSRISVLSLKKMLSQHLKLTQNWRVSDLSFLHRPLQLHFKKSDTLEVSCTQCTTPGKHNFKLSINNKKVYWLQAHLEKLEEVYITNTSISSNTLLKTDDFHISKQWIQNAKHVSPNREQLLFSQTTRPLRQGHILSKSDLRFAHLIKRGMPVEVIYKGKQIQLKSKALAKKSGKIHDFIPLMNLKSKKVFLGKIINYNRVLVEL